MKKGKQLKPPHGWPRPEPDKIEQSLDGDQREVLLYLFHVTQPATLDAVVALTGLSITKVLNIMEKLRTGNIVYEKREYGKGAYFLRNLDTARFLREHFSEDELREAGKRAIEYYSSSTDHKPERLLILAELHQRLECDVNGLIYLKNAADHLARTVEREKAIIYYDRVVGYFSKNDPAKKDQAELFLESLLGKIALTRESTPVADQIMVLRKAEECAKRYRLWKHVAGIKALLGRAFQDNGQYGLASTCVRDFYRVAAKTGDKQIVRSAAWPLTEYLFWRGKFSEAVHRYEETIGSLEEFGDDPATLKAGVLAGYCHVLCGRISRGMGMIEALRAKAELLSFRDVVILADMQSTQSLLEMRKTDEAEKYLDKLSSLPEETLSRLQIFGICLCRAYILYAKHNYQAALVYHEKALEHARAIGWTLYTGTWIFEYLSGLEQKGLLSGRMEYDREIERVLGWDNIYMRGVAFRHRASRNIEKGGTRAEILADFNNSVKCFKGAGAEIELARTRIVLGNYFRNNGQTTLAQEYFEKAWMAFAKVGKEFFPKDLLPVMPEEQKVGLMIDEIIRINESTATVTDRSSFLERVLDIAIDFSAAMKGAFLLNVEDGVLKTVASRSLEPSLLSTDKFKRIGQVIADIAQRDTELVFPGEKAIANTLRQSLSDAGITSFICMPARLHGAIYGYLYLENRFGGEPFPENHLPFLRLICSQTAVALSSIDTYREMRELKDRFEEEATFYKREMGIAVPIEMIVGTSESMRLVIDRIRQVAPTGASVLIEGETGVGKELVAKAIHNVSDRKNGPFISVNLAALPQELVASELFGHEKGAFTGAHETRKGRFELADGGTLFLDEIGDLPFNVQVKLLRVLQEGVFERLGSAKPIHSDFRIVAATNKELRREVENNTFRQDLYYRLNVFPIRVPSLRERKEDIPQLVRYFLDKYGTAMGKPVCQVHREEMKKLIAYRWPGNVRELEHIVQRALVVSDGGRINFTSLDQGLTSQEPQGGLRSMLLDDVEKDHVRKVLGKTLWKVKGPNGAAAILGLKPTTLFSRMKKLGIKRP
jgi:transcriptional regulator with GAF, ATPase, and Fis domain/tetratricopeptide (TPR) repeat protein